MRRRLVVSSLALVLAALVAFAVPLGLAVRGLLQSRALDGLQGAVEQVALVLDVTARDCDELRLRVVQLGGGEASLTVVAAGGAIVATTAPEGRPLLGGELRDPSAGRAGRRVADGRVAVAVPLSTTVCGRALALHGAEPDTDLRSAVRAAWLAIAGVAVAVAGFAAGSAWWLGRQLAGPFEALARSARRLGEGDFSARAPRAGLPEADGIADALDGTAERLGRAVERSATFTADASHQLRTPLTALSLHLEALDAAGADPEAVAAALAEVDRLETTIEDLVALTRVDEPEVDVDLCEVVAARLPAWRALAFEHGRALVDELLPVPPVRVRAGAVAQAVQVLVDNAIAHAEGRVTVRVAPAIPDQPDGAVRVCVADEGPGPAAVRDRPGGRGLPLARTLVAAEGGQLTVAAAGGGSVVCLLLPVARSPATRGPATPGPATRGPATRDPATRGLATRSEPPVK